MRVFVTGATGFVGSAVVPELIDAGHEVVGLARSDASAAALTAAGAEVQRGSLEDLDTLRIGATGADGVIHLAYIHDFSDIAASGVTDLRAVETIRDALTGTGKPFVNTSGMLGLPQGVLGTEEDGPDPERPSHRAPSENASVEMAALGIRSSVVRLAPSVHGEADKLGFVPNLIGIARAQGTSAYVGDGSNRWPAVHQLDAARLYRLALESAPPGTRWHAAGDEGIAFRDIATAIGEQLQVPVVSVSADDAAEHFGWMAALVSMDNPTSSALTRERLGWQPEGPTLIVDIEKGFYFD